MVIDDMTNLKENNMDLLNHEIVDQELKDLQRLMFINRQPTLWSHSIPVVEVIPQDDDEDNTIGLNPLFLEPLNADFDGDTAALYNIHETGALKEMYEKAFIKNRVHYEQNKMFLSIIRHESLYGAYILTLNLDNLEDEELFDSFKDLKSIPEKMDFYNDFIYKKVYIESTKQYTTYGNALLNKWCQFDSVVLNLQINKGTSNEISRQIYKFVERDSQKFYNLLDHLNKMLSIFVSVTNYSPTININDMINILKPSIEDLFKKITFNNIWLGYYINESLVERSLELAQKEDSNLYKLYKSGSRFNKIQLSKSCINNGYVSDQNNIILSKPINSNLLNGMTEEDFFLGSPGTRKGI